jgi:hypothetical protein
MLAGAITLNRVAKTMFPHPARAGRFGELAERKFKPHSATVS